MIVIPETREAWLEERKYGIGASEAAPILGMSRWKSNVELWEEKIGLREPEDISDKPVVKYGHDAEPHIRALFALDHPEYDVIYESPYKIIRNEQYPFIFATPDGELTEKSTGRKGGLEIKTTEIRRAEQWKEWNGRIPDHYYCQICHQMLATGWEYVWLTVQIKWTTKEGEKRKELREYYISREDAQDDIAAVCEENIKFWGLIESKTRPPLKLPMI